LLQELVVKKLLTFTEDHKFQITENGKALLHKPILQMEWDNGSWIILAPDRWRFNVQMSTPKVIYLFKEK